MRGHKTDRIWYVPEVISSGLKEIIYIYIYTHTITCSVNVFCPSTVITDGEAKVDRKGQDRIKIFHFV